MKKYRRAFIVQNDVFLKSIVARAFAIFLYFLVYIT